mgnify:FL=1|tara:strand:- start:5380 stop:6288 length:909 start_codon:yes stop_codon:yes gene_type:complete
MIYNFKISKPIQKNNIVVFFLKNFEMNDRTYLNLNEGLSKNKIGIEEYDDVGYRDLLNIKNLSDESLLLLNGEQIIGHKIKQNRVVASTTLIEKNSEGVINVSCGEKNRWSALTNQDINTSDSMFFSRQTIHKQNLSWIQIDNYLDQNGIKSLTKDSSILYKKNKTNVDNIVESFKPEANVIGLALGNHYGVTSLDVFSNPLLFKHYYKKILRSYVLANLSNNKKMINLNEQDVNIFLENVYVAKKRKIMNLKGQHGEKYSLQSKKIVGNVLYDKAKVVHFTALLKNDLNDLPDKNKTRKVA